MGIKILQLSKSPIDATNRTPMATVCCRVVHNLRRIRRRNLVKHSTYHPKLGREKTQRVFLTLFRIQEIVRCARGAAATPDRCLTAAALARGKLGKPAET